MCTAVRLPVRVLLYVRRYVGPLFCLFSAYLLSCLLARLSVYLFVYSFVCFVYICVSVCLTACLSLCRSTGLPVCPWGPGAGLCDTVGRSKTFIYLWKFGSVSTLVQGHPVGFGRDVGTRHPPYFGFGRHKKTYSRNEVDGY